MDPSLEVSRIQRIFGECQLTKHQANQMSIVKRKLRCLAGRSSGPAFHSDRCQLQHSRPFFQLQTKCICCVTWLNHSEVYVEANKFQQRGHLILYYIILSYIIYRWHAHIKSYQAIHDMTSHVWQTSPTCSNASGLISAWAGAAADIASQMLLIHSW